MDDGKSEVNSVLVTKVQREEEGCCSPCSTRRQRRIMWRSISA